MTGLPEIDGVTDLVEIGRGGFGVVYLGTETSFDRQVAVKVLLPSLDERSKRRFERERRAMGSVSGHPNIVTVYRGGLTQAAQPYLVMEYLPGGSLTDQLHLSGPLDWSDAAAIGAKLSDALTVAHRAGILHRDVKPANVFLTASGEPKLGDFGIARLDDGHDSRTGSITASIAHAPPEIVNGHRGDERSDLYSLASTVYALTTGFAPFSRDPDQGLASLIVRSTNDQPPALNPETAPADFEQCLLKALNKRPHDRHATVAEFGNELQHCLKKPVPATAHPFADPNSVGQQDESALAPSRSTNVRQIGFLAFLALAIAAFGGWAVARAVLNTDDDLSAQTPSPVVAAVVQPTPAAESTTPPPFPVASTPAAAASATVVPTATPAPQATATSGGDSRSSDLGSAITGFTRVQDFSGAISVDVPQQWGFTVQDGSTVPLDSEGLDTIRVLSAGGTLEELSADSADRDLTRSGIYIFAARLGEGFDSGGLLDVALDFWSTCTRGDRSQILLPDGNADFQILDCERPDGESTGVVVLALVPRDDPEVAVSVFLQFAEIQDLSSLPKILGTLDINASQIPASAN